MERPNGFLSFLWGLLMIGVVVAFVAYRLSRADGGSSVDGERAAKRVSVREQTEKADQEKLHSLAWVDKAKGVVHLPLSRAQELVAAELATKKKGPSTVAVDAPLPPAAPYDPNAAEPAPPARGPCSLGSYSPMRNLRMPPRPPKQNPNRLFNDCSSFH